MSRPWLKRCAIGAKMCIRDRLVARVRALFRRAHQADEPQVEVLDFGDLVIDISGHKILVEGKEVGKTCAISSGMIYTTSV